MCLCTAHTTLPWLQMLHQPRTKSPRSYRSGLADCFLRAHPLGSILTIKHYNVNFTGSTWFCAKSMQHALPTEDTGQSGRHTAKHIFAHRDACVPPILTPRVLKTRHKNLLCLHSEEASAIFNITRKVFKSLLSQFPCAQSEVQNYRPANKD